MGQGYSLTTLSAGSAGIDVPELSDLTYEKSLGDARFMKAIRARHRNGLVVAKVVMKPYASMKFGVYIKQIARERDTLNDIPNVLAYHRAFETSSNGYLIRQYINNSIYDRMSTRPFLEDIEKRWLAFQLLSAVRDCHSRNIYHGDIKTENALVTSWNWLYLSDFSSSFKPTYLPEDNPADFSFFFDISGRRTCYLAPERFLTHGESAEGRGSVTWAMDIFSVGCVIAELFLEGPIFNLSQLFKYRQGAYNPEVTHLGRIEDPDVRELVSHMIQLEPESRYSADEYLNFWRRKAFPEYFYSFLHQYMLLITNPAFGQPYFISGDANPGESDDRIDQVYFDFDKISYFLGYESKKAMDRSLPPKKSLDQVFPLHLDVPSRTQLVSTKETPSVDDGTLLFLNVVTSALRSTARSTARIRACELLLIFAQRLTDEAKLDRILPFVVSLLNDPADIIKVAALRTLTQLVDLVATTSPVNAYLFPEYIIPRLEAFIPLSNRKSSPLVRATYASCMALLAETAGRFLDIVQAMKAEGFMTSVISEAENGAFSDAHQNLYDIARADLVKFFETQTKALLTDPNSDVRRAFLGSVSSLCVFFGSAKANDVILSHLNTYLNDRDWKLKCAFFETIVGVAVYVGSTSLEEFILPLMVQALTDPEESVVEKVLRSLSTMAQLGLFQRSRIWELVDLVSRFTMHPNFWVREAAAHFISSCTKFLTVADCECVMKPLLQPYLHCDPLSLKETDVLDSLKKPLLRSVLDMAVTWASKSDKGIFWKPVQARLTSNVMEDRVQVVPSLDLRANALTKVLKNEEDHRWLSRLQSAGMSSGDEFKLLALRDYIWRMAQRKIREAPEPISARFNELVSITSLGVDLETVFFDRRQQHFEEALSPEDGSSEAVKQPQTIADALLDASTTIDGLLSDEATLRPEKPPRSLAAPIQRTSPKISSPLSSSPTTHTNTQEAFSHSLDKTGHPKHAIQQSREKTATAPEPPVDGPGRLRHNHSIRRTGSAINLMQRSISSSKATAEISTSSANAVGRNVGLYTRQGMKAVPFSIPDHEEHVHPASIKHEGIHSYSGRDPNVLRLLDTLYLENYPIDTFDFGPSVNPVERRASDKRSFEAMGRRWRPNKRLVATFREHDGPVTRVAVSPDHLFFITASDDGSVRVWDSARLEQNLTHRSKQIHRHAIGAKVTSICFVENTHCFVSTGSDGSVHVVKVDCTESSQGYTKYGKLRLIRHWRLPDPTSYAIWTEHFKSESQSILILATNECQIISLDLKSMNIVFILENPAHYGIPTCFCMDRQRHWLLLGTSHGVLSLWDLRFRLRLRSWGFHGFAPITRLALHPSPPEKERENSESGPRMRQKLVFVTGGTGANEATLWNLERATCVGVYRTAWDAASGLVPRTPLQDYRSDSSKRYVLVNLDNSDSSNMLQHFATWPPDDLDNGQSDRSIKGLAVGNLSYGLNERSRNPYMITAGPHPAVHFWDLNRIENSGIVNGVATDQEDGSLDVGTEFVKTESPSLIPIYEERLQISPDAMEPANMDANRATSSASTVTLASTTAGSNAAVGDQVPAPPTRTTVINDKQQKLLKSHLDSVLDVAVLEYPFRMILSVDRSGIVLMSA